LANHGLARAAFHQGQQALCERIGSFGTFSARGRVAQLDGLAAGRLKELMNQQSPLRGRLTETEANRGSCQILIAEDSPTQAELLKYILEEHDFGWSLRATAEKLDSILNFKPTLVITAVAMPEMDGYELCHRIRLDERIRRCAGDFAHLVLRPGGCFQGLECGADNFITKPTSGIICCQDFIICWTTSLWVTVKRCKPARRFSSAVKALHHLEPRTDPESAARPTKPLYKE